MCATYPARPTLLEYRLYMFSKTHSHIITHFTDYFNNNNSEQIKLQIL